MQAARNRMRPRGATLGYDEMAETLEHFVIRRRRELAAEFERLSAEMAAFEAERDKIERVAMMIGLSERNAPDSIGVQVRSPPRRLSEATIKGMVLNVLSAFPQGQTALEILERINATVDVPYPRTSLSPQLSRLKAEGKIHREGRVWKSGVGPDDGRGDDQDAFTQANTPAEGSSED
jgi:hypothetical protein